jgi:hypothetical protein
MGMAGCSCRCGSAFRSFYSAQEVQECLKSYEEQLKKELTGVKQRIKELDGE